MFSVRKRRGVCLAAAITAVTAFCAVPGAAHAASGYGSIFESNYPDGLNTIDVANVWANTLANHGIPYSVDQNVDAGLGYDLYASANYWQFAGHSYTLVDPDGNHQFNALDFDDGAGNQSFIVPTAEDSALADSETGTTNYAITDYNGVTKKSAIKMAVLQACETNATGDADPLSLTSAFVASGASAAVGFNQVIYYNGGNQPGNSDTTQYGYPWTNQFWTYYTTGGNASDSASEGASYEFAVWGNYYGYDSWAVAGNASYNQ